MQIFPKCGQTTNIKVGCYYIYILIIVATIAELSMSNSGDGNSTHYRPTDHDSSLTHLSPTINSHILHVAAQRYFSFPILINI